MFAGRPRVLGCNQIGQPVPIHKAWLAVLPRTPLLEQTTLGSAFLHFPHCQRAPLLTCPASPASPPWPCLRSVPTAPVLICLALFPLSSAMPSQLFPPTAPLSTRCWRYAAGTATRLSGEGDSGVAAFGWPGRGVGPMWRLFKGKAYQACSLPHFTFQQTTSPVRTVFHSPPPTPTGGTHPPSPPPPQPTTQPGSAEKPKLSTSQRI